MTADVSSAAGTTISGTLASVASTTFRIEFFANQGLDASGHAEGQTYLGFTTVTTDTNGNATFTATTLAAIPTGEGYLTATATNLSTRDTSQFSPNLALSTTTTVGAGPFTYDGTVHAGGSGTVTGPDGFSTSATSVTYSGNSDGTGVADQIDAGTYYVTAHYAGDTNHTPSNGAAVAITINKATLPVSVTSDLMLAGKTGCDEHDEDNHRDPRVAPPPLTGMLNGAPFTVTTTFKTAQGDTLTVTLSSGVTGKSDVGAYPIVAAVTGAASANYVQPTSGNLYVVTTGDDSGTGARNVSFWDTKGNAKLITAADLTSLDQLNLRNDNGSNFDPTTAAQLDNWLRGDTDHVVKALSIQLAVMDLNVLFGYVKTTDVVYAGNLLQFAGSAYSVTGLDGGGFITVGNLTTLANNSLANYTAAAKCNNDLGGLSKYLDALEDALEAANNNTSFVQPIANVTIPPGI